MGEEQGLAGGGMDPQQQELIKQVIQMLMQGADPQELVDKGVPPQIVQMAIQIIQEQQGGQGMAPQGAAPQGAMQ